MTDRARGDAQPLFLAPGGAEGGSRRVRVRSDRTEERAAKRAARAAEEAERVAAQGAATAADDVADEVARVEDEGATAPDGTPRAPLLVLRDGLPDVVDTEAALADVCRAFADATGPVAIDAERASGYRYSARAYLIQLRREGAGTALIDPVAFRSMEPLQEALGDAEWILHAATQDLPCLTEVGLRPSALFDTELAGRLLGHPRVGLATLVETELGHRMRKEHSAADWSTRPLPKPWLEYAALDVEVLLELREVMHRELDAAGKLEWALQEFEHLLGHEAPVRHEAWRRTTGTHKVRGRRGLAAVKLLWETRDEIARERDVTPGRLIPDSALVTAAIAMPRDKQALLSTKGFHGRGAERYAHRWVAALTAAAELPESELPQRQPRSDGPPPPRAWADRDPVAARRLAIAREDVAALAEQLSLPPENLLTPDFLRRTLWQPPATRHPEELEAEVARVLASYGARPWQVERTAPLVADAVLRADAEPVEPAQPTEVAQDEGDAEGASD